MSGSNGLFREQRGTLVEPVMPTRPVDLPAVRGAESASRAIREQAQAVAAVTDPLERILQGEMREMSRAQGEEDGAAQPLERDAEGVLQPPDLSRQPFTTTSQEASRQVLLARYGSELIRDNAVAVQGWRAQAQEDPERFRAIARGGLEGISERLPAGLRPLVMRSMNEQVTQHYAGLMAQQQQRQRVEAAAVANEAILVLATEVGNIADAGGDPTEARARLQALITANREILPPGEALRLTRNYQVIAPAQQELRGALRGMDAGSRRQLIAGLRSGDVRERAIAVITGFEGARYDQQNGSGSTAFGRYQITEGFYAGLRRRDPSLPDWARFRADPATQDRAMAVAMDSYQEAAQRAGIPFDERVALGMHFLGAPGYTRIRAAAASNPDAPVSSFVSEAAMRQNGQIFRTREGRVRSVGEVLSGLNARVPNLSALAEPERRAVIAIEDDAVGAAEGQQRATAAATRTQQAGRVGQITREIVTLRQDMEAEGAPPPTGEQVARLAALETELDDIVAARPEDAIAAEARGRLNPGSRDMRIRLARAAVDAAAGPEPEGGGERQGPMADLYRQTQREAEGKSLGAQEVLWRNARQVMQRHARTAEQAATRDGRLAAALNGGPQATNSPADQATALRYYASQGIAGPEGLMSPDAPAVVTQVAAAGTLPEAVPVFMAGAIQSGNAAQVEQGAAFHRAMMRTPRATAAYEQQVPKQVREAYEGLAAALSNLPAGEARQTGVQQLVENARQIMQRDPQARAAVRATLGTTPAERDERQTSLVDAAFASLGGPTTIPDLLRAQVNERFLDNYQLHRDPERAARDAVRSVTRGGWTASTYGLPVGGMGAMDEGPGLFRRAAGAVVGGATRLMQPGAGEMADAAEQWVRGSRQSWMQNAPEVHVAPGPDGASARWQERMVRDMAAGYGARGAGWRLGQNAFWRPTEQFADVQVGDRTMRARLYELWAPSPTDSRVPQAVGAMRNGREIGTPRLVPLAAEAERARLDWQRTATPAMIQQQEEAIARQRQDEADGAALAGGQSLMGLGMRRLTGGRTQ